MLNSVRQSSVSERLAAHVVTTAWEDLPEDAIAATRRMALDTLACAWAGTGAPGLPEASALLLEQGGKPESVVWARGQRVPARTAAFVNSAAAAALDEAQTCHAYGIALSQAAATQLPNISHSLTKRFSSAFAAHAGVFSALLAARGITGPRLAFEGDFGFYNLYQQGDPDLVFTDLGETFPHVETALKKYPSCACNHTAIEATLGLVHDHALVPEDVERVEVTISPYVDRLVGAPFHPGSDPQVAAQFSIQYSVAAPILRGRFSVLDIEDPAVLDPAVGALARAVQVHVDPAWANRRGATVAITSRRHGLLSRHVELIPGSPGALLSQRELDEKVRNCLGSGPARLSAVAAERLIERLDSIESLPDMARFFDGIA